MMMMMIGGVYQQLRFTFRRQHPAACSNKFITFINHMNHSQSETWLKTYSNKNGKHSDVILFTYLVTITHCNDIDIAILIYYTRILTDQLDFVDIRASFNTTTGWHKCHYLWKLVTQWLRFLTHWVTSFSLCTAKKWPKRKLPEIVVQFPKFSVLQYRMGNIEIGFHFQVFEPIFAALRRNAHQCTSEICSGWRT